LPCPPSPQMQKSAATSRSSGWPVPDICRQLSSRLVRSKVHRTCRRQGTRFLV
jgi:hypothetical protein